MLLGAVGCIGAWFEKKVLLFIVNNKQSIFIARSVFLLQYIITMIVIFVVLLLGVVFVIAFNEQVNMIFQ